MAVGKSWLEVQEDAEYLQVNSGQQVSREFLVRSATNAILNVPLHRALMMWYAIMDAEPWLRKDLSTVAENVLNHQMCIDSMGREQALTAIKNETPQGKPLGLGKDMTPNLI